MGTSWKVKKIHIVVSEVMNCIEYNWLIVLGCDNIMNFKPRIHLPVSNFGKPFLYNISLLTPQTRKNP